MSRLFFQWFKAYTNVLISFNSFSFFNSNSVPGGWTDWSTWSDCMTMTGPCETGLVKSFRNCTNPAPKNGGTCPGSDEKQDSCIEPQCNYILSLRSNDPPVVFKIEQNSLVQCANSFPNLPKGQSWGTFFLFQSTPVLCYGLSGTGSTKIDQCLYYKKETSMWEEFLQFAARNVMTLARISVQKILLMGGNGGIGLCFHK